MTKPKQDKLTQRGEEAIGDLLVAVARLDNARTDLKNARERQSEALKQYMGPTGNPMALRQLNTAGEVLQSVERRFKDAEQQRDQAETAFLKAHKEAWAL